MHVPQVSLEASVAPTSALDAGLHKFVGLSWHVLLPYTILGGVLMLYSQSRLVRGQKVMRRTGVSYKRPLRSKVRLNLRSVKLSEHDSATIGQLKVSKS